jgi:predicted  nucleic acid-binding Zn-ribbon protein
MRAIMSQPIDQFREELRAKLAHIDAGLDHLSAAINDKAQCAEEIVRTHLEDIEHRIKSGRARLAAAQTELMDWLNELKAVTQDKIAEWKLKRETDKLHHHADRAERYAAATLEIAAASVDAAEQAAVEAWLARQDATSAQVKQAVRSPALDAKDMDK